MSTTTSNTAVILIDVYNDFLHPEGKMTGAMAESLEKADTIAHLKTVVEAARKHNIPIYYGLHQQYREGHYDGWKHMGINHPNTKALKLFEEGSWGGQIYEGLEPKLSNGDVVLSRHWNSSSFQNTDLQYQLGQRDITHLLMAGLTANTCLETTARYGYELGYNITMISDATAAFTVELKEAATDLIWPVFANRVITAAEWVAEVEK